MGMLTSSAHLQRFTEALLRPFTRSNKFQYTNADGKLITAFGTAVGYVDDVGVVTFGDLEAHEALLRLILAAMDKCKLRVQPAKCEFFRTEGTFLGHVLSKDGISQQTQKLDAITNWPALTDLKSVRAFVSLCSYYRKFIKDFAGIAQPLTDLLKKDAFKTPLTSEALGAFENLKTALTSAPVLSYFDSNRSTELFVDASKFSIGAVLQQIDDHGDSHPVGYYSRRLNAAEQNYATYDKELLGLRDGVLHFRHYLLGIRFKVHTDHSSLRWLLSQPEVVGQRQRWLVVLSEFEMTEIAHIPGAQNIPADVLSRYPDSDGPSYEHLIPEQGNMDVRFNSVQIAEQEYLFSLLQLANLETPAEVSEQSQFPGTAETPHGLPTPARLFSETGSSGTADVPTLLPTPESSDSTDSAGHATDREPNAAVCPHCRSSTCDTCDFQNKCLI